MFKTQAHPSFIVHRFLNILERSNEYGDLFPFLKGKRKDNFAFVVYGCLGAIGLHNSVNDKRERQSARLEVGISV